MAHYKNEARKIQAFLQQVLNLIITAYSLLMNPDHNPFRDSDDNDDNDGALDIMRLINQIAQSPSLPGNKPPEDRSPLSIFSGSYGMAQSHHPRLLTDPNASCASLKRQNPVKTYSIVRKRVKLQSQHEDDQDDSQFIDSLTNRKITEYFEKKHESLPAPVEIQKVETVETSVIRRVRQKISLKKKILQELKSRIDKETEKLNLQEKIRQKMEQEKRSKLIAFLSSQYQNKIYNSTFKIIYKSDNERDSFIKTKEELKKKIDALKEGLKKNKNKGDESISYLQQYTEEHQDYIKQWKKKVQEERRAVTKEIERQNLSTVFIPDEEEYHELPQFFLNENNERIVLQKNYLPLYSCSSPQNLRQGFTLDIKTINLKNLREELMMIISYPKIMKMERRMNLKSHLEKLFALSHRLCEGRAGRIFLPLTFFGHPPDSDMLLLGRKCWEGVPPIVSLTALMKHYECLGEGIGKYVVKVMLRAHQESRYKLGQDILILPRNIVFDQRNDIRIQNWLINQTYKYEDFLDTLIAEGTCLYLPPEFQSQLCIEEVKSPGTWVIGVILYELIYGKKPFEISHRLMDYEEFYMMNDLSFPQKPSLSEQGKDFLKSCLAPPSKRLDFMDALKHPYFECNSK